MELSIPEIIGLIAATITTSAFVPQVYKTWKTKDVEGLSLTMYSVFFVGVVLWVVFGYLINSISVFLANFITALLVLLLIIFKIRYSNKD